MKPRTGKTTAHRPPDPVPRDERLHEQKKSAYSAPHARGRSEKTLPGDRGANEQESTSQGSE